MRQIAGVIALLSTASWLPAQSAATNPGAGKAAAAKAETTPVAPPTERFTFHVEWRLIHAGQAVIDARADWAQLRLQSAGLLSSLYKVQDTYSVSYGDTYCAAASVMDASEGKRHHETRVSYDASQNRAFFTQRDIVKGTVVRTADVAIPSCVHDVLGGMLALRRVLIEPGTTIELPVSDGRRNASVKVEAQEREEISTHAGTFKTIRFEAKLLDGVIYGRQGRVFLWISDDPRRLPVQIRLRMNFPVGTVTLELEKEETL
jgi:hypothetical protein